MSLKNEIIKIIESMAGKYSAYEVFSNWVECMALSIANSCHVLHDNLWLEREERYKTVISRYDEKERQNMTKMFVLLSQAFEEEISDVLGEIYMKSGAGSKAAGQFFTPFHLSVACAEVGLPRQVDEEHPVMMNEPSTGGGGMIIAVAKILKDRGINYQRCMHVVAQDLDYKAVYMTYVQLSLLGIKARVCQGNTLQYPDICQYPRERIFLTPALMLF